MGLKIENNKKRKQTTSNKIRTRISRKQFKKYPKKKENMKYDQRR
jgi:hypothetical protein